MIKNFLKQNSNALESLFWSAISLVITLAISRFSVLALIALIISWRKIGKAENRNESKKLIATGYIFILLQLVLWLIVFISFRQ